MENVIYLQFDKILTGLAGYDYGLETYNNQVAEKIDFGNKITIVFPDTIQRIASSFIQGFFANFVRQIGISGIENNITIRLGQKDIKEKIINNLL